MANVIKIKRSTTGGNAPSSLNQGELAIQLVDKRIFTANATVIFDAFQNTVSNVSITNASGYFKTGNSTVNSFQNSTCFALTVNTTVNFVISAPSAGDYAAGTKVLLANGSWGTPAGGGSPGGSNTHVQFNDSSSLGGTAGFTFDKATNNATLANTLTVLNESITGNLVANSDYISIGNSTVNSAINSVALIVPANTSTISSPSGNSIAYFGKNKANRIIPITVGSSGWDTPIQGHFMHNTIYQMLPTTACTAVSVIRMVSTISGSATNVVAATPTSANLFMSQCRLTLTANATANQASSWRNGTGLPFWRGNAAGLGGFYAVARFGISKPITNSVAFIGFSNTTAALGNANPNTFTNTIGFGKLRAVGNLQIISANSTASNTIDTGLNFSTGNTNWYEGVIFAPPNGGTVSYQVTNLTDGTVVTGSYNQTNLPTNTTFLTWHFNISNMNQAANTDLDCGGVQIEVNL